MPSSGTFTFQMTRDDIITSALRLLGVFSAQDAIPPEDILTGAQALNIIVKELLMESLPLWCVSEIPVPLQAGVASYNLSTITGQPQPQRVLNALLRTPAGQDLTLAILSRYDYLALGNKLTTGTPNQLFFDPQLGASAVVVSPVPADSLNIMFLTVQRQVQDFNLAVDNPDFPQEAARLLKWMLADEIALEYQTPKEQRDEISAKAQHYLQRFTSAQQEQASIYFTPSTRKA